MTVLVKRKKKVIKECDAGAMGNPCPPGQAATTAAEQSSNSCIGSGDSFGYSAKMAVKSKIRVRKHLTNK